jgi:hypothetical protein
MFALAHCFVLFASLTLVARVAADKCTILNAQACNDNSACCLYKKIVNTAVCLKMANGKTTSYTARPGLTEGCQCIKADCSTPPAPTPAPVSYCKGLSSTDCANTPNCCFRTTFGVCIGKTTTHQTNGQDPVIDLLQCFVCMFQ